MEIINKILDIVMPESFDVTTYLTYLLIAITAIFVVAGIVRLSFGKGSILNGAIASAIAILTIYVINILVYSFWGKLQVLFEPLPFVSASENHLTLFSVGDATLHEICREFINITILAYVMNLLETWLPKGDKLGSWFSFRFFALIIAVCLHYCVTLLMQTVFKDSFLQKVPLYLLGITAFAFLLGCLKMMIGGESFFVKTFLGAFHAFFFTKDMGKQLMRALSTAILLTTLVVLLNYYSYTTIAIAAVSFFAYFPIILVGLTLWYVISKFL